MEVFADVGPINVRAGGQRVFVTVDVQVGDNDLSRDYDLRIAPCNAFVDAFGVVDAELRVALEERKAEPCDTKLASRRAGDDITTTARGGMYTVTNSAPLLWAGSRCEVDRTDLKR